MTAKIRRARIRRVDLVDEGAAPDAHILIAKNRDKGYGKEGKQERPSTERPRPSSPEKSSEGESGDPEIEAIRARVREFLARTEAKAGAGDNGMGAPMEEGGEEEGLPADDVAVEEAPRKPRISHLSPEDFEVTSEGRNLIEWSLPEDKLPEGIDEVTISQVKAGESARFQWMMDPVNGPPMEGTGKTADEAFTALRAAITQHNGMDPNEGLGGLPMGGNKGGQAPQDQEQKQPMAKRLKLVKRAANVTSATVRKTSARSAENTGVNSMPELDLEALAEALPDEILDYIDELETENASLIAAAAASVAKSAEGVDVDLEKALAALPEASRAILKAQTERLVAAEAALAEEQLAKSNQEWVTKAAAFDGVIDNAAEFGPVLRTLHGVDPEAADKLVSALSAAATRMEKSALFSEMGHNIHIETDTEKRVDQLAKSLREATPDLTTEEARWQVFEANPELYDAHVVEHRARAKSV